LTEAGPKKPCYYANINDADENLTPETLLRKYASAVLGLCMAHTKNFHDSEDIMQDVFIKALMKFDTLRDKRRTRPWLLKIARRMCIDFHRKHSATQTLPDDTPAPTDSAHEHIRRLHTAISKLPDGYREPIILYYLDGRKCASVAKNLGISEDAVRSRLVRARLRLHEMLLEDQQ
jgi:RNA polymerase sigma-70 factor (ECF subfamily)